VRSWRCNASRSESNANRILLSLWLVQQVHGGVVNVPVPSAQFAVLSVFWVVPISSNETKLNSRLAKRVMTVSSKRALRGFGVSPLLGWNTDIPDRKNSVKPIPTLGWCMPTPVAPFEVASVQFAFRGNPAAIPLRDPHTLAFLGATPEWTAAGSRQPAAFVGGTRPWVRVVFQRLPGAGVRTASCRIGAAGERHHPLVERTVKLEFNAKGVSQPVDFRLQRPLPAGIGEIRPFWNWYVIHEGRRRSLGKTRHLFYHTWKRAVRPAAWAVTSERTAGPFGELDAPWVYEPLMRWTCQWAAGRRTEKGICDAVLAKVRRSGLRYAEGAWNVGQMLVVGGGYCGGWFRMFQAMVGAQGVRIHRRAYLVDWRMEHRDIMRWCAIVVSAPGVNRKRPVEQASTFHDSNVGRHRRDPVQRYYVRRYRFWGHPGSKADGHCINFLQSRGRWYVYDSCFFTRPVALSNFTLPRCSATRTIAVEHQGSFQRAYLNRAVGHMLGSLRHAGKLYKTELPEPSLPDFTSKTTRNGLSVKTAIIPGRWRNVTFYWMK
jgi:hypothetical protein